MKHYSTALRPSIRQQIERIGAVDILVGVPCFNNESTIAHVLNAVESGLTRHFPHLTGAVFLADGGSVDDTREVAMEALPNPGVHRIVSIYRGIPGKGTAVRSILEAADLMKANVCALFDADLRSISPEWVKYMADAILSDAYDFVAPYYSRFKYDGTITNTIVYPIIRALFGHRVRQPIGGDFAFSRPMIQRYMTENVWETDVARFGIDIWLTTTALAHGARVAQVNLGAKIHDVKDPAESLGPMLNQVVSTLLSRMEVHAPVWKLAQQSAPVPMLGPSERITPRPFTVNLAKLVGDFKAGFFSHRRTWQKILARENWQIIEKLSRADETEFSMGPEQWSGIVYDFAAAFHHCKGEKQRLVNSMTPLYFARVAALVNEVRDLNDAQAEEVIERQAEAFEQNRNYLVQRWDEDVVCEDEI
ncbi:MAG: glycosyltransferase [Candidatus Zhuqueibacterota bacterium]